MATKEAKRRKTTGEVPDLARQQTTESLQPGKEAVERVEDEAREVAGRAMLREAPYAGIGLGHVVAETVRHLDASSLPERLRRTPGAVASKVGDLGTNAKVSYLALAARGRAVRLSSAGDDLTAEVQRQTKAVVGLTKDTATATRDVATETVDQAGDTAAATGGKVKGVVSKLKSVPARTSKTAGTAADTAEEVADQTVATAAATGGKVKGVVGKLKGAATRRTTKPGGEQDEHATEPAATPDSAADTGTGPLEKRTVAQLRERASELGIEGRTSMKKKELIQAIRDAT
jgi:hypothetical protein